jgi:hypothetical protein
MISQLINTAIKHENTRRANISINILMLMHGADLNFTMRKSHYKVVYSFDQVPKSFSIYNINSGGQYDFDFCAGPIKFVYLGEKFIVSLDPSKLLIHFDEPGFNTPWSI